MTDPGEYANHPEDHLSPAQLARRYGPPPEPEEPDPDPIDELNAIMTDLLAKVHDLSARVQRLEMERLTLINARRLTI